MKSSKNWSPQEDKALLQLHLNRGFQSWSQITKILALQFKILNKTPKICRERYINHLNPEINRQEWTQAEETVLLDLHNVLGNRWAEISRKLPGRTDNSVKNKFFSKYRRAIKNINQILNHFQKFKVKELKIGLVYKLINFLERKHRFSCEIDKDIVENARCIECGYLVIKNQIITFEQINFQGIQNREGFLNKLEVLLQRIHKFNLNIKRKPSRKKITKNSKIQQLCSSSQSLPLQVEQPSQNLIKLQAEPICKQQQHPQPLSIVSITNLIPSPKKPTQPFGMGADNTDNFWQMENFQAYYNI